jgi:hypothetical protein
MLNEYLGNLSRNTKMMWWFVTVLAVLVSMSEAGVPLPRKVVLNGDNLEILRLDIMSRRYE